MQTSLPLLTMSSTKKALELAELLQETRKLLAKEGQSTESYRDPMLMRFLKSNSMDPVKASKMVERWKKWREEFVPLGYIPECEILDPLTKKTIYLQGLSISGHPVLILKCNKYYPSKDVVQHKKVIVHLLDKTIASCFEEGTEVGDEKIITILDMGQISYKNVDISGAKAAFNILQSYYPNRLEKLYILDLALPYVSIWKMISCFLNKKTQERVVIVKTENDRRNFIEEIGKEILPQVYGGEAKLVLIQDVILKNYPKD